ncbi:hypothetical protein V2J09_003492 [Rumex salicifolius]
MLLGRPKKAQIAKGNRVLITINVLGSAGPMRFVVYEEELVNTVIDTALKSYARAGRLPVLGSVLGDFQLYCPAAGSDCLMNPWEAIGAYGSRNFMLCKKQPPAKKPAVVVDGLAGVKDSPPLLLEKKGSGKWKAWINRSLSFKIASH